MPMYRKKPVDRDCEQWFPGKEVRGVLFETTNPPDGEKMAVVRTAQGQLVALTPGDWVVLEPDKSGYYPIKDEIFRKEYDLPVDEENDEKTETVAVDVTVPSGVDTAKLVDAVLSLGWDSLHARGGDPGWQELFPALFDGSPDRDILQLVDFGKAYVALT